MLVYQALINGGNRWELCGAAISLRTIRKQVLIKRNSSDRSVFLCSFGRYILLNSSIYLRTDFAIAVPNSPFSNPTIALFARLDHLQAAPSMERSLNGLKPSRL